MFDIFYLDTTGNVTPAGMIYQGPITYVSILGNYRNLESIHHTVVLRILVYIYTKFVL